MSSHPINYGYRAQSYVRDGRPEPWDEQGFLDKDPEPEPEQLAEE